ncbi:MAG TPA: ferrochelatase [Bryobacteraceae bacterium]|jgi:ferrochelatase|nr:ferrochelatase [Bryobacteraceae bacterium]
MYEALLVVSFGGPEKPDDVLPFLENVTRGRNVPRERLLGVAEHYYHFGGKSPINDQNRALIAALEDELPANGIDLPIYWGNRNWQPTLTEALSRMKADGIKSALAFVTSAYSSYSSCRQYRENIAAAQAEVGPGAPKIDKLRVFYNHPGFIEACADRVREALAAFEDARPWPIYTAHSIPTPMADTSDYERQFHETARLVTEAVAFNGFEVAYQSRSGAPNQPWLGPDILERLRRLHSQGFKNVLVAPVGFISDHMEVLYDLDIEAQDLAKELGMKMVRAGTAGTHPAFIRAIRQLIQERLDPDAPKLAIGKYGPNHDVCPDYCCPVLTRAGTIHALASREP